MTEYVVFKSNGIVGIDTRDQFNDGKSRERIIELASFPVQKGESIPQLVGKEYQAATVHGGTVVEILMSPGKRMALAAAVVDLDGAITNVPAIVGDILNPGDPATYELVRLGGLMFAIQRPAQEQGGPLNYAGHAGADVL